MSANNQGEREIFMKGNLEQEKTERTEMGSRERPILFSGAMVRAILSGGKTQTRRVVRLSSNQCSVLSAQSCAAVSKPVNGACGLDLMDGQFLACPYGKPGDRLWVREEHFMHGRWEQVPDVFTKGGQQKWCFVADSDEVMFDAAQLNGHFRSGVIKTKGTVSTAGWHKRLARFMPRKASRIMLEIVSVRGERLHDICEADAVAEGIDSFQRGEGPRTYRDYLQKTEYYCLSAMGSYRTLWELINGPGSWGDPWVWVVEFKRL